MSPITGILLKLGSVFLFTVMGAILKATAPVVPTGEQVFFRSLFAIPVILAWLAWRGELATGLKTRDPMAHAYRGIVGSIAMGTSFAGLGLLPFPEATALGYAMPLLTVIFAGMFLAEPVRGMQEAGATAVLVEINGQTVGAIAVRDELRPEAAEVAGWGADAHASCNRTCELGMTKATLALSLYLAR